MVARPSQPQIDVSTASGDCHVHLFGPYDRYPLDRGRLYTPGRPRRKTWMRGTSPRMTPLFA
jgi:hypothetical protein